MSSVRTELSTSCADCHRTVSSLTLPQQDTITKPSAKVWQHWCFTGTTEMEFDQYQCPYHCIPKLRKENSFVEFI